MPMKSEKKSRKCTMEMSHIVVGAGMWGCTLARRFAEAGHKVLVLEKRAAVGGNCRCEIDPETGIEVHTYGSHIFHTSNRQVWDFVNRFTGFNDYRHVVLARARAGERWRNEVEVERGRIVRLVDCSIDRLIGGSAHGVCAARPEVVGLEDFSIRRFFGERRKVSSRVGRMRYNIRRMMREEV